MNRNRNWYYSFDNPTWKENLWVKPIWTQFYKMPQNYSYINIGSHGVGYAAWLEMCKVANLCPMDLSLYHRIDFARHYVRVAKEQSGIFGITLDKSYQDSLRKKILSKLQRKVPVFCLVRDPISVIKSFGNVFFLPYLRYGGGDTFSVTLDKKNREIENLQEIENLKLRCINDVFIFLLDLHPGWTKTRPHLCYTSAPEQVKNATKELYYFDMQSIVTSKQSLQTFRNICEILNLPKPQDESLFDISFSKESFLYYGFPFKHVVRGLDIPIIYTNTWNLVSDFLEMGKIRIVDSIIRKDLPIVEQAQYSNDYIMLFGIQSKYKTQYYQILEDENLMKNITDAAQEVHNQLEVSDLLCRKHRIDEQYVLDFLKKAPKWIQKLQHLLQYEVSGVLSRRPDIVANWKYYLEFEEMCKVLDKLQ
ncbi:DUF2972 domain-containing protein [Helicobacter muridarum]|uniref:DUF2972 domain-containing protein n=1 Tax=Helicobacter muridarum TaxID=216 RepID=A0A099U026_9HELI|nr:DUF2972 domain-containing protein [Helicobacter muridarum]TLE00767.1 DUF2972 domain-containing protein [Helicobacter muridarum]STQ86552.1 Protein of uncharacterised function (DUF2972) [Helicobacter muridarum]